MSLMEIWKAGARIPFIVENPLCQHTIVVTRYNWIEKHFEGFLLDHEVELSPDWFQWEFVREA